LRCIAGWRWRLGDTTYEWRSIANFVRQTDHCQLLFCDFVHVYYPQAQEIGDSTQPVDGFVYSAMFGWVLAPVGKLAPDTALTVWGVFQVALTTMMVLPLSWLFLRGAERFWWRLGYFGLGLTSIPLFHNFKWGQVSVLVTVCVIMAAFVQRGRAASALAGFLVAFAAAIKFYPAVFLLIFLFRKQWLALASAVVMFVVLLALPMGPMGYDRFKSFSTAKLVTVIERCTISCTCRSVRFVFRMKRRDFCGTTSGGGWLRSVCWPASAPYFRAFRWCGGTPTGLPTLRRGSAFMRIWLRCWQRMSCLRGL
jgi:hypothetical protein